MIKKSRINIKNTCQGLIVFLYDKISMKKKKCKKISIDNFVYVKDYFDYYIYYIYYIYIYIYIEEAIIYIYIYINYN